MPGYQSSELRMDPPNFEHLSERLGSLVDALGHPVHLLGHSIGGMLALEHAVRRSDQIKSMILVGTTPRFGGRDDSFKEAFLKARLGALDAGQTMAEMAAETAPRLVGPSTSPEEIKHIEAGLADVPEQTWRGILRCLVQFDRAGDLNSIARRTLAIAGSLDGNAPAPTMRKMAERMTDCEFRLIESAGHMPHQEMPNEVNALVTEFLQDTPNT
jgi:pimeloyl-ACP methyl ester carboxylesterase